MSDERVRSIRELEVAFGCELPRSWCESRKAIGRATNRLLCPFELSRLTETANWLSMPHEIAERTLETASRMNSSAVLQTAAEIADHLLFRAPSRKRIVPEDLILPLDQMFYVPVFLAAIPELRAYHRTIGVDPEDTRLLLRDIERWVVEHRARYGCWGLSEMKWLRHHFWGDVFQIGRLQYQFRAFEFPYRVLQSRSDERIVTVLDGRYRIRSDGQFADADTSSHFPPDAEMTREMTLFVTECREDEAFLTAHPVAGGRIDVRSIRLDRRRWKTVLALEDPALAVHIPAGEPLSDASVADSTLRAQQFYNETFPEYRPKAFTCDSWLLDPQLASYLPGWANVIRFQRRFTLAPLPGANDHQHFERVYHIPIERAPVAPRDTKIKRALFDHVEKGMCWRITAGFILIHKRRYGLKSPRVVEAAR